MSFQDKNISEMKVLQDKTFWNNDALFFGTVFKNISLHPILELDPTAATVDFNFKNLKNITVPIFMNACCSQDFMISIKLNYAQLIFCILIKDPNCFHMFSL